MKARALEARIRQAAINRILDTTPSRRRFCASDVTVVRMHGDTFMLQCDIWQKTKLLPIAAEEKTFYLVAAATLSACRDVCAVSVMPGNCQ